MPKLHGSANSDTKLTERRNVEGDYNSRLNKMQKEEYLIKNACYSVTKYYLCKRNNKRSLLGRKQRSQVARSLPNRYQFSCTNKETSLFSISCILRIVLRRDYYPLALRCHSNHDAVTVFTGCESYLTAESCCRIRVMLSIIFTKK